MEARQVFSSVTGLPPHRGTKVLNPLPSLTCIKRPEHMAGEGPSVHPPPHTERYVAPHMFMS